MPQSARLAKVEDRVVHGFYFFRHRKYSRPSSAGYARASGQRTQDGMAMSLARRSGERTLAQAMASALGLP
jgi:hypothetical protein